jgi:large subunit ribosomal protein L21
MNYAIIETGGKQYKVAEGQTIDVEKLNVAEGGAIELDKVLLIVDGENITTGKPVIEGARVMATVKKNGKTEKIIVFKFKAKARYRRKNGHRQAFTSLTIDKILPPGAEAPKPAVKRTRRKKAEETVKTEEKADNGA